nr:type II toxin-antitoxin system antitoxin SocA domain-containing protein [Pseudomonas gingeri]
MKQQKLVYYSHGWHAGYTDQPLINEAVETWQYGPVIPSLYHEFKRFGSGEIVKKGTVKKGTDLFS